MNEHVDELLALYALGGLEPDELEIVTAHLAGCAACRAEAERILSLVAAVAAVAPARAPDPRLRARVLSRAGIVSRSQPQTAPLTRPAPASRRRLWPAWLATSAALVLVGLLGWNLYLTNQVAELRGQVQDTRDAVALVSSPTSQEVALQGQGNFATAAGSAYIDQQSHSVVLIVEHLPPLPVDKTYQAWIITDQGPQSAGLFQVGDTGWGMNWLEKRYAPGGAIGVSLEPQGGSAKPTQVVLLGKP
jgi:anti-sigma-K factor RskA